MRIFFLLVFVFIIGAGGYFWYQKSKTDIPATIHVGVTHIAESDLLFRVLKDQGFDKKNNLNLIYTPAEIGDIEREVRDRIVDVGGASPTFVVESNKQGIPLRSVAPFLYANFSIIVKSDSKYQSIADLKGAKLAVLPKATAGFTVLAAATKDLGYDLEKDFKVTYASIPDGIKLLTTGEADGTFLVAGPLIPLLSSGHYRLISDISKKWGETVGSSAPLVDMVMHQDFIDKNKAAVKRYQQAVLDTVNYIHEHPEIIVTYKDIIGIKDDQQVKLAQQLMIPEYPTTWDANRDRLYIQKSIDLGLLKPINYQDFFLQTP